MRPTSRRRMRHRMRMRGWGGGWWGRRCLECSGATGAMARAWGEGFRHRAALDGGRVGVAVDRPEGVETLGELPPGRPPGPRHAIRASRDGSQPEGGSPVRGNCGFPPCAGRRAPGLPVMPPGSSPTAGLLVAPGVERHGIEQHGEQCLSGVAAAVSTASARTAVRSWRRSRACNRSASLVGKACITSPVVQPARSATARMVSPLRPDSVSTDQVASESRSCCVGEIALASHAGRPFLSIELLCGITNVTVMIVTKGCACRSRSCRSPSPASRSTPWARLLSVPLSARSSMPVTAAMTMNRARSRRRNPYRCSWWRAT